MQPNERPVNTFAFHVELHLTPDMANKPPAINCQKRVGDAKKLNELSIERSHSPSKKELKPNSDNITNMPLV